MGLQPLFNYKRKKLISQRRKEALERLKKDGVKLGREIGSKNKYTKLDPYKEDTLYLLEKGNTKISIAKKYKVHINTLYNYLKLISI